MSFWDIVESLSPVVAVLPLTGDYQTVDEYGRAVTVVGTPVWERLQRRKRFSVVGGYGLHPRDAGCLTIAHGAEQLPAALTIFVATDQFGGVTTTEQYLVSKEDAGAFEWSLSLQQNAGVEQIIFEGAAVRTVDYDVAGAQTLAARLTASGAIPDAFVDGARVGAFSGAVVLAGNTPDMALLARFSNTLHQQSPGACVLVFPSALTELQIAQLDEAWRRLRVPQCPLRFRKLPGEDLNDSVLYVAGDRLADGDFPELIQGLNGTPSGIVVVPEGPTGMRCMGFHGQGGGMVTVPNDASYISPTSISVMIPMNVRSLGESNFGRVFALGNVGGAEDWRLIFAGANLLQYRCEFVDGLAEWDIPFPGVDHEFVLTLIHDRTDGTNLPQAWIDREEQVVSVSIAKAGNLSLDPTYDLYLGARGSGDRNADSDIGPFKFWNKLLTDAEREQELVEMTNRPEYLARRFSHPVSLANIGAGGRVGPFDVLSGTHRWTDDGARRKVTCVTAGGLVMASPQQLAHGSWYVRMQKSGGGNAVRFLFMANARETFGGATVDGYQLLLSTNEQVVIQRVTNGVVGANVITSAVGYIALGVEYEFFIVRRRTDDRFQVWIRGGAYPTWTSVGTGTDSAHNTATFYALDLDAGDTIGEFLTWELGAALVPTDVFPD